MSQISVRGELTLDGSGYGRTIDNAEKDTQRLKNSVEQMGKAMGQSFQEGSSHANSGAMRETLVLMREISQGNWTRVPGSFTLLLDRLGVLGKLFGNTAQASDLVAKAHADQAVRAGAVAIEMQKEASAGRLAAKALIEKAEASKAVAIADSILKDKAYEAATSLGIEGQGFQIATNAAREKAAASEAVYLADLQAAEGAIAGADASIMDAGASSEAAAAARAKAVASAQAAEANAAAGIGSLAKFGIAIAVVLAVAVVVYETFWGMKKALEGFKLPDSTFDYVAKGARNADQFANAQQKVTDAVRETAEAYNDVENAAKRVSDATKEHFDHLRKMNSFEKDPAKKAAGELEIDRQEKAAELSNKAAEMGNLEVESRNKLAESKKLSGTVMSEEEEKAKGKILRERAEAAKKFIADEEAGKGHVGKAAAAMGSTIFHAAINPFAGVSDATALLRGKPIAAVNKINASIIQGQDKAQNAINAEQAFLDGEKDRKRIREEAARLANEGARSASAATKISLELPDLKKKNAQELADKAEELNAGLKGTGRNLNSDSLTRTGNFLGTSPGSIVSIGQRTNDILTQILQVLSGGTHAHGGGHHAGSGTHGVPPIA